MRNQFSSKNSYASEPMPGLLDVRADHDVGLQMIDDRHEALQAYLAFENGDFDAVQQAFDAHTHSR